MTHNKIFNLISRESGLIKLGQWNHNLLATTYEWNRGLKERGQKEDGFEISISRTIPVPVNVLYNSWADAKIRIKWLCEKNIIIRKTTENKSLVIKWSDATTIRVELYKKDIKKTQAVVQHSKILNLKASEKMKEFWSDALHELKNLLMK